MVPKKEDSVGGYNGFDELEEIKNKNLNFSGDLQKFPEGPLWESFGPLDTFLQSPHKWLKKKAEFDGCGKLWRVRDGLYDLVPFIKKHPGGSDWIETTQGQDITELFMSSHVINLNMVESVLKKYYVKEADTPRKSPYTFNENDFFMTFKRRCEPILKKVGTKPDFHSKLIQDGLGVGALLTGLLGTLNMSYPLLVLSGFFLFCVVACTHNFCHGKDGWRKYWFAFTFLPPQDARIMHCVSHHVFPNTRLDFEAMAMEPFMIHRHVTDKWFFQKWGPLIYMNVVFLFGLPVNFLLFKMFRIFVLREHNLKPENLVPFVHMAILGILAPTFAQGAWCWLVAHMVCSYCILCVGYTAAHHDPTCYHDGDKIRKNPDWGVCQMDATIDTPADFSENMFLQSIFFGEHPLHHLFPTVCHSKFALLKPVLMDTMKEFGMSYPRKTKKELVWTSWNNLFKTKANDFDKMGKIE